MPTSVVTAATLPACKVDSPYSLGDKVMPPLSKQGWARLYLRKTLRKSQSQREQKEKEKGGGED